MVEEEEKNWEFDDEDFENSLKGDEDFDKKEGGVVLSEEEDIFKDEEESLKKEGYNTEINQLNEENEKKQNRQVMWAIILMVSLIVIILGVPFITKNYINKFDVHGLEFQKTRLGDLIFYSTKIPKINGLTGDVIGDYSINFRSDPRELDYIELVDIPNNTITFMKDMRGFYTPVYLSLDSNLEVCEDSGIALMNLAGFLRDSGLEVKSAVTNKTYAEENDIEFATCLERPGNTVIRFHSANKTAIYKTSKNCYDIVFKDCEIIPVTERFELIMLEEYLSHFEEVEE